MDNDDVDEGYWWTVGGLWCSCGGEWGSRAMDQNDTRVMLN